MTSVYRLNSSRYPARSGRGAAITGGRWNRPGTEVIYTAASRSLAIVEVLVHYAVLPKDFVLTEILIPDTVPVLVLKDADLPAKWNVASPIVATQNLAERLLPKTAVLSVPSAVVSAERNYVLNPRHDDFQHIVFRASEPFRFDPRLK